MNKYEVIVTATAQNLLVQFTDINTGDAINLTGCTDPHIQGHSVDLPDSDLDVTAGVSIPEGTITSGIIEALELGNESRYVSLTELGSLDEATYICEVRVTASGGKYFFSPRFQITWKRPVIA